MSEMVTRMAQQVPSLLKKAAMTLARAQASHANSSSTSPSAVLSGARRLGARFASMASSLGVDGKKSKLAHLRARGTEGRNGGRERETERECV